VAEAIFTGKDKETFAGDENARSLAATQATGIARINSQAICRPIGIYL